MGHFTKFGCVNCTKDHVIICCPGICTFKHATSPLTAPHWACSCPDMVKFFKETQVKWWQNKNAKASFTTNNKCKPSFSANLAKIDTGANFTMLQDSSLLQNIQSRTIPVKTAATGTTIFATATGNLTSIPSMPALVVPDISDDLISISSVVDNNGYAIFSKNTMLACSSD
jgi:hypothetical protein